MKFGRGEANRFGQLWSVLEVFDIPSRVNPERVYLKRLRILQTPYFGVYLHHINEPDTDRDPHDHPWPMWSFILRGGYREHVWMRPQDILGANAALQTLLYRSHTWNRFSLHYMPCGYAHLIKFLAPDTVTLVVVGRRSREWGFWTPEGFVEWKVYERFEDSTIKEGKK